MSSESPIFSTPGEAVAPLAAIIEACERLPVAGQHDLEVLLGRVRGLGHTIQATVLVQPALAGGTHRYREVRGLPLINENPEGTK